MIKFSVSRLDKEAIKLSGSEGVDFVALPEEDDFQVVKPMCYDLSVTKVSGGALVSGRCSVTISGICGRCLENVEKEVSADDIGLFVELENAPEEIDISDDIREELLINLPMNLVCKSDCRGLCPDCGANLNNGDCSCANKASGSLAWSALDDLKL